MPRERHSHIKFGVVSRSKSSERATGGNAVALSAYHACARLEHDGKVFDFTRKRREKVAETQILLPDNAPSWAADPAELWRRAEANGKRKDAQIARWINVEIPREVPADRRAEFAAATAAPLVRIGMAVQIDVHCPRASDGGEQPHAHLQGTMRRFNGDSFGPKADAVEWDNAFREEDGRAMRRRLADAANAWLAQNGVDVRINPEKRADDGIQPERDVSRAAIATWKNAPDIADEYPTVLAERRQRRRVRAERASLAAEIAAADQEIINLQRELDNVRHEAADAADIRPNLDVDAQRSHSDTQRHATDSRPAPAAGAGGRRGQDRPASGVASRRSDKPRRAARKSRPAQRQAEDIALGRAPRRSGDDDLQQARDRLRQADGRGAKARRRARERAEFNGPRPDADERLHDARRKARNAGAPGVGPSSPADRLARRRRFLAGLLRSTYDTGWLDESAAANIKDIKLDKAAGIVTLFLIGGGKIIDNGERITLTGKPTSAAVTELITAADRHGWTAGGIEVSGDADFKRAIAIELLSRRPPVAVTGLDDKDRAAVAEVLEQRQRDRRRAALAALGDAERVATEAFSLRPNGRRETEVLTAVRDAQAAVSHNDNDAIDAAMSGDIPSAMRAGMAWRERITPKAPAVDMTIEPDAPAMALLPAYVPPWVKSKDRELRQ